MTESLPQASLLTTRALLGLGVLVPLSLLWLGALLHCTVAALRGLRISAAGGDASDEASDDKSPADAPLTWLLLLLLGSFVAAIAYTVQSLWLRQRAAR